MQPFDGAKVAILYRGRVLSLLRDDRRDIPYPGLWDLPGGGREGAESPSQCALREAHEETGLCVGPQAIRWGRAYGDKWFFVAGVAHVGGLRLRDEGQALRWFRPEGFVAHPGAIPEFRARLADYLREVAAGASSP